MAKVDNNPGCAMGVTNYKGKKIDVSSTNISGSTAVYLSSFGKTISRTHESGIGLRGFSHTNTGRYFGLLSATHTEPEFSVWVINPKSIDAKTELLVELYSTKGNERKDHFVHKAESLKGVSLLSMSMVYEPNGALGRRHNAVFSYSNSTTMSSHLANKGGPKNTESKM